MRVGRSRQRRWRRRGVHPADVRHWEFKVKSFSLFLIIVTTFVNDLVNDYVVHHYQQGNIQDNYRAAALVTNVDSNKPRLDAESAVAAVEQPQMNGGCGADAS